MEVDVAIIGGGISGLYCAWRLSTGALEATSGGESGKQELPQLPKKICVFEADSRTGGRLASIANEALPHVANIGGMRYLPSQHIISDLVERFTDLERYQHDFPVSSYFVRGRHIVPDEAEPKVPLKERPVLRNDPLQVQSGLGAELTLDLTKLESLPDQDAYRLHEDEQGLQPGELVALGISRVLPKIQFTEGVSQSPERTRIRGGIQGLKTRLEGAKDVGAKLPFDYLSPHEWTILQRYGKYEDTPLWRLGFWDLVQGGLSHEAFAFLDDGMGYKTIIGTWNSAEAMPWFLHDFSTEGYFSLKGGMEALSKRVERAFVEEMQSRFGENTARDKVILQGWKLRRISPLAGRYELHFDESVSTADSSETNSRQRHAGAPPSRHRVVASKVILALPAGALKQVEFSGLSFNNKTEEISSALFKEQLSTAVTAHPLLKMFLLYKNPWWWDEQPQPTRDTDPGQKDGEFKQSRIFTDLPLRQLYYHGPTADSRREPFQQGDSRWSMIMAYCDARHAEYWDAIARPFDDAPESADPHWAWCDDEELPERLRDRLKDELKRYGVAERFAIQASEQVWRVHYGFISTAELPRPFVIFYTNWANPPHHGGWHSWNIGDRPWSVRAKMARPFDNADIHVCGESLSCEQGWVEGALRSAERVLLEHFRLAPIDETLDERVQVSKYDSLRHYVTI